MTPPALNAAILLEQIRALGEIGREDDAHGGGRTRLALSAQDQAGRDQLVQWMRELDLDIRIDRIGNILGILPAARPGGNAQPLMMGSHIDTVRHAGALDGCYGVLAALAVIRAWREAGALPPRALVAAAFTNEEGVRFQPDMMGSLVYAGGLDVQAALERTDADGVRLGAALEGIGYAGAMQPGAIRPREYLELHIEQGPVLEAENCDIGVVENLQGISWQRLCMAGVANHAGTTPTRLRHDAAYVACAIAAFVREQVAAPSSGQTLGTVGCLQVEPNLINVIAHAASLTVDLRDCDAARLHAAEARLAQFAAAVAQREGVQITFERLARFDPVVFDAALCRDIAAAAQALGLRQRRMTSGAGHDAQMMARIAPSAMIFVPSTGGISHNPREHTPDAQLIAGAQVLLHTVQRRLYREGLK